jgi:hypothetical protein
MYVTVNGTDDITWKILNYLENITLAATTYRSLSTIFQLYRGGQFYWCLQLPMQSVPITTDVSSNLDHGEVYNIM